MIRRLDQLAEIPILIFGPWLFFTLVLLAGVLIGLGWHFWPRWLPRRSWWRALKGFARGIRTSAWRRRQRQGGELADPERDVDTLDTDERLPDRTVVEFLDLADAYAAQGRFREAIRERLRAVVRTLVDRGVIEHHPEWTVTELVAGAARTVPGMRMPLDEASRIFSEVWYGERPAGAAQDDRMRTLAGQVDVLLAALRTATGAPGTVTPVVIG